MTDYLVGSDVGTGGTKSVIIDTDGNIRGSHFVEYPLLTNNLGYAEHNPEWYWNAVADTMSKAITDSKINPKHIKGVSISALSPACILVDKNLEPLQLAHIWMDRRSIKQCQWLKENIGEDRIFEISSNPTDPYYAATKIIVQKILRRRKIKFSLRYRISITISLELCLTLRFLCFFIYKCIFIKHRKYYTLSLIS